MINKSRIKKLVWKLEDFAGPASGDALAGFEDVMDWLSSDGEGYPEEELVITDVSDHSFSCPDCGQSVTPYIGIEYCGQCECGRYWYYDGVSKARATK